MALVLCQYPNYLNLVQLETDRELQWCPKFSNLTDLTLGQWCLGANFSTLTIFLQNSPMLEKLTLKLPEVHVFQTLKLTNPCYMNVMHMGPESVTIII